MASTASGRLLTQQHRRRQLAVRARYLNLLLSVWPLFDPTRIDETWRTLEPVLLSAVQQGRAQSSQVAGSYYQAFHTVERAGGRVVIPPPAPVDMERVATSLRVTGPVEAKRLVGLNRPNVRDATLLRLSGALGRHVLDGGRSTLIEAAGIESRNTGRRVGWARVTSFDPCAFCALLASRGPVYSESTADFRAHDHCACSAEPVVREGQEWPGRAREWSRLYQNATRDADGDLLNAFRRAYEGRAA